MKTLEALTMALVLWSMTPAMAAPTQYDQLMESFQKAATPTHADLSGYWAGRCADSSTPNVLQPAIFLHRLVDDAASIPPVRPTISYFTEKNGNPAIFDKMTLSQVEAYPAIRDFFSHEQWQAATVVDGALVNYYQLNEKVQVQRAARLYVDEFNKYVVLRAALVQEAQWDIYRYCYFTKRLIQDLTSYR